MTMNSEVHLANVFVSRKYCGAILRRGLQGHEAIDGDNVSHGTFPSQREAAAALQQLGQHVKAVMSASAPLDQALFLQDVASLLELLGSVRGLARWHFSMHAGSF